MPPGMAVGLETEAVRVTGLPEREVVPPAVKMVMVAVEVMVWARTLEVLAA